MRSWDTAELQIDRPEILSSSDAGRVILLELPAGELLQEHEVHERAWLIVVEGEIEVEAEGTTLSGTRGFVAEFGPQERREVRALADARLLLVLAPWPGDGHPGAMSLDQKATARERARERAGAG